MSSNDNPDRKPTIKKEGGSDKNRRYRGRRNQPRQGVNTPTATAKYKGDTEELHCEIYNIGVPNQAELFTSTTKKVASYAGRTCKYPQDIRLAIKNIEDITISYPLTCGTGDVIIDNLFLSCDINAFIKREATYESNKATIVSVVIGQCSDALKAKLESKTNYDAIHNQQDVILLLKMLQSIAYDCESQKYPFLALHASLKRYYGQYQKYHTTNDNHMESFNNHSEVVKHCRG